MNTPTLPGGIVKGRATAADPPGAEEFLVAAIDGTSASKLSDLDSLMRDVTVARRCVKTYLDWTGPESPQDEQSQVIRAALWSAAVISYRRAFNSGKALGQPQAPRLKIPDDWTKSLKQAQRNAHDEALVIANKHVAHRVGDHEVGGVRALFAPPPEPREVVGIVSALGHVSEPVEHLPELLLQVCDVLIEKISGMKDELSNAILEGLRQQDVDALYDVAVGPIRLPQDQSK
jgi:hypothetical protein